MLARFVLALGTTALLSACGLAETGAAAGATGAAAAEQAQQAETITEGVKTDIAAAQEAAAEARRQAEAASE
jgi:hypothetical protein